jgi:hypothetical protein
VSGRRALASGVAAAAVYAALAALSGWLSPLARGPLLDGLGPPLPYRWVSPPPELADGNVPPSAGVFRVELGPGGSKPATFVTSDNQVTLIVPADAIGPRAGARAVEVRVDPLDPSTLPSPGGDLRVFGNAYRIRAVYRPSGGPVRALRERLQVILVYPVTANLYTNRPVVLSSPDGTSWRNVDGSHSGAQQQIAAEVAELGFLEVAGALATVSPTTAPPTAGGANTLAIGLLVAAACMGLLGVGLILRGRGP